MAAKGLRAIRHSDTIEPMVILLKDENKYVRIMAVRALGAIGGKNVKTALNEALESENDEKVKEAIIEAMK